MCVVHDVQTRHSTVRPTGFALYVFCHCNQQLGAPQPLGTAWLLLIADRDVHMQWMCKLVVHCVGGGDRFHCIRGGSLVSISVLLSQERIGDSRDKPLALTWGLSISGAPASATHVAAVCGMQLNSDCCKASLVTQNNGHIWGTARRSN